MSNREEFEKWCTGFLVANQRVPTFIEAYESRQAEIDALKAEIIKWQDETEACTLCLAEGHAENAALKAENGRLRIDADNASLFLLAMSSSPSVSPTFQQIAKRHHQMLEDAMKEEK